MRHNAQTILARTRSGCADPILQDSPVWRIVVAVVVVVVVIVGVEKDGRNKTLFNHRLDHGVRKDFDDPSAVPAWVATKCANMGFPDSRAASSTRSKLQ